MECILCKCRIITNDTINVPAGVQYGVQKADDKWYCTGCSDVADFAIEVTTITEKKPVTTTIKTAPIAVSKPTSVILFYCSTCKETATGTKCEKCGNMNPMCIRKKKGGQGKKK